MSPGSIALAAGLLLLVATALGLMLAVRGASRSRAAGALDRGDFQGALAADPGAAGDRDARLAAAVGAKHLLELERAAAILERLVGDDPSDGEAWLELGLVAVYRGDHEAAAEALERAAAARSDLAETVTLHRAWVALDRGDAARARRLFEEVEAPVESKLRHDLGPGDPLFSEWFLHAAALWRAAGDDERSRWARDRGLEAGAESPLAQRLAG